LDAGCRDLRLVNNLAAVRVFLIFQRRATQMPHTCFIALRGQQQRRAACKSDEISPSSCTRGEKEMEHLKACTSAATAHFLLQIT
jgi:hypothetical protein